MKYFVSWFFDKCELGQNITFSFIHFHRNNTTQMTLKSRIKIVILFDVLPSYVNNIQNNVFVSLNINLGSDLFEMKLKINWITLLQY
jgi:hypothetical protein